MYTFVTFKMVPPQVMEMLSKAISGEEVELDLEIKVRHRRLSEKAERQESLIEKMNTLFIGGIAFVILVIGLVLGKYLMKRYPKVKEKIHKTYINLHRTAFFNAVHLTAQNACIPL